MYLSHKTPGLSDATLRGQVPSILGSNSEAPRGDPLPAPNLSNSFDADLGIFWSMMRPEDGRGCFTLPLIRDMTEIADRFRAFHAAQKASGLSVPKFFVSGSAIPGTYNLGGDLAHFAEHIRAGNREMIKSYGHCAVEAVYQNSRSFDLPVVTIALVQGDALGGGLECALSYDVIIAERSAKVGFPEALFNLFPGMGAYSFLSRRIGRAAAERLIMSGKTYSAEDAFRDGVVDVLAEDGQGESEVKKYAHNASKKLNMRQAVYQARRRVEQVTYAELIDVVDVWADAAMRIGPQDLRMMDRLARAQGRRLGSNPTEAAPVALNAMTA